MVLLSHFSSDSGEAHGKSLAHIFSSHGSENGERARMAYWAVSGRYIPPPIQTHTKQKQTHTFFLFLSVYLAVIYRRPLGRDSVLSREAKRGPVSPLLVYSAPGHCSTHLRGKCHKIHTHKHQSVFELLCFAPTHNCAPHLKIVLPVFFFFCSLHSGCISSCLWTISVTVRRGLGRLAATLVSVQK